MMLHMTGGLLCTISNKVEEYIGKYYRTINI